MPNPPPLQPGTQVAPKPGKLAGADPFTRLLVIDANDDGTYAVALVDDEGVVWKRVPRRHLTPIEA